MDIGEAIAIIQGAVSQTAMLSAPFLLVALAIGLIVSILQATTSIQEQTLTFVPKIAGILLVLALLGGWMFASLSGYTRALFESIPDLAR
jgi:flagellar biosynthetic protein FliQ